MSDRMQQLAEELMTEPDKFMLSFDTLASPENPYDVCKAINDILIAAGSHIQAIVREDNGHGAAHIVSNTRTKPLFDSPPPVSHERSHALPDSFFDAVNRVHPSNLAQTDLILAIEKAREKEQRPKDPSA